MSTDATPAGSDSARLEELLLECLDRIEEEGALGFAAFCREHPGEEKTLRRRVALLHGAGFLEGDGEPTSSRDFPERLGEFRLIDRIGGGGMGVVYRAWQEPLDRQVALKVIRSDVLYFPGTVERFQREMTAVARLSHPGIVPVHTVGEQDGVPFFAMEYVEGCSLGRAVARVKERSFEQLSGADLEAAVRDSVAAPATVDGDSSGLVFDGSWADSCARVVIRIAEALQHVHDRGMLHRDVKPSNVMVTPEGRVMLIDFGLATAEGDVRLTRTGAPLGSLPYMSPEQLEGGDVDARTDVFSLGITLYEMLTARLPFAVSSAGTASRKVVDHSPPASLRGINAQVSWELETVCLTALDPDPARRYVSARAMARDLTNALEHRPILARRPGPWLRARRFMQRHPTGAAAVSLVLLVLAIGAFVYAGQQRRAKEQIDRQRLEAIRAVDRMLTRVARDTLVAVPYMEEVRRELLEDALEFYEGFLDEAGADPSLVLDASHAWNRVAEIQRRLGRAADAETAGERAIELLEALGDDDPGVAHALAGALNERALLFLSRGARDEEARVEFERSLSIKRALVERFPADVDYRLSLANGYSNYGGWLTKTARSAEAREPAARAVELLEQLRDEGEGGDRVLEKTALALMNLAGIRAEQGELREANEGLTRALGILERLSETRDRPEDRAQQGMALLNLHTVARRQRRTDDAKAFGERTVSIWEGLASDFPRIADYGMRLAHALDLVAQDEARAGRPGAALERLQRARDVVERLRLEHPETSAYGYRLAGIDLDLARLHYADGQRIDDSFASIDDALGTLNALRDAGQVDDLTRLRFIDAHNLRGAMAQMTGRGEDAVRHYRAALGALEEFLVERPHDRYVRRMLMQLTHNLAMMMQETDLDEALAVVNRGLGAAFDREADGEALGVSRAQLHTTAGGIHRDRGDLDVAESEYRAALELREEQLRAAPNDIERTGDLGGAKSNLASVLIDRGELDAALSLLREAVEHERAALAMAPDHPYFGSYLGRQLKKTVEVLIGLDRPGEARTVLDELAGMAGFEDDVVALRAALVAVR